MVVNLIVGQPSMETQTTAPDILRQEGKACMLDLIAGPRSQKHFLNAYSDQTQSVHLGTRSWSNLTPESDFGRITAEGCDMAANLFDSRALVKQT
ncbi:hypothetical protein BBP40_000609 [Aspergillus hancockii]|nr:hypothetical protein BBP40_000609 [Aspergillus hancockii]